MSSSLPSIMIAGGAGYIGSHTAMLLKERGYKPVVVDNLITGNRFAARFGPFIEGAIEDFELVRSVVRQYNCKAAILLAAHAYVGESITDPKKYYRNNVMAPLRFLDALMAEDVSAIVYSSSCSVYGVQNAIPIVEQSPKDPLSPYAETKAFLEQVLRRYGSAYGVRSVCLRYFNAAGADAGCALGESHDPETHLIPRAIYAAMGLERLEVFGTDYETRDGTAVRDYIHVTDLAAAHLRALEHLLDGGSSLTVNLGTGTGHTILETIRMVERVSGRTLSLEFGPRRQGDAPELVADPRKANSELAWEARCSSLENIVRTAWRWHVEYEPRLQRANQLSA